MFVLLHSSMPLCDRSQIEGILIVVPQIGTRST
ncbi:hypothetical protein Pla163_01790 [Planctomycetes bacterium Pla163]|uniref:Uncharacterized protein n=1 Tax=Rohdeia mirabilis TaxID=2528008 RepID=A0A518CV32_9BACT|nr:hypothetical protein Pla163_01790 [Planctomycetes bacterium Pla163]